MHTGRSCRPLPVSGPPPADTILKYRGTIIGLNLVLRGRNSPACMAEDLVRFGEMALRHPASRAFLSWPYDSTTWAQAGVRTAREGVGGGG
jgi:hypothetical protein